MSQQEERLMILQMVAEKKISASEAAELLKALDDRGPAANRNFTPPAPKSPPPPPSPTGLGGGFSAFIEEIVDRVSGAFTEFTGPRYEFPTELSGIFTGEEIPLRVFTGNGHVELKGWDQAGYKAEILVKARGQNEAEARARAAEAFTVRATESEFELETNRRFDWSDLTVSLTLWLPKGKRYRLESRTGNGHITVEGVTLTHGTGSSGNGRITFRSAAADRLYLKSGNGSIEVEGDVADLEVGTGNGSVSVTPLGRRSETMQVKTGNGSVTIDTGRLSRAAGLYIDAHTGMGGVAIGRSDLVYERDDRSVGNKHVIARTQGYETAEDRVTVRARTGLGSISVE